MLNTTDFKNIVEAFDETILVSPTGSGKTSFLINFFLENDYSLIYLSPLRALADELEVRLREELGDKSVIRGKKTEDFQLGIEFLKKNKKLFFVATVESVPNEFFAEVDHRKAIICIDEVHLFYHWGESFRPLLMEKIYEIKNYELPIIGLTATLSKEFIFQIELDCLFGGLKSIVISLGNYGLCKKPAKIHYYHESQKEYAYKNLMSAIKKSKDTVLVFCKFRNEVDDMVERFQRLDILTLGCVSGEVERFRQDLKKLTEGKHVPKVIVATTCLSHGVNLPKLSHVFILYPVQHRDFWIQMTGRAGRKGEEFEVHEMNGYNEKALRKKSFDLKAEAIRHTVKFLMKDFINYN